MPTVYVLDDESEIIDLVSDILSGQNIKTEGFNSPLQFIDFLKSDRYDVDCFLLDFQMPEMTGFEVLNELKKIPGYFHTPVIFFSANSSEEIIIEGYDSGAHDFITKPFRVKEFISRINRGIEHKIQFKKFSINNYGLPQNSQLIDRIVEYSNQKSKFILIILWQKNLDMYLATKNSILTSKISNEIVYNFKITPNNFNLEFFNIENFYYGIITRSVNNQEIVLYLDKLVENLKNNIEDFYDPQEIKQGYFISEAKSSVNRILLPATHFVINYFEQEYPQNINNVESILQQNKKILKANLKYTINF